MSYKSDIPKRERTEEEEDLLLDTTLSVGREPDRISKRTRQPSVNIDENGEIVEEDAKSSSEADAESSVAPSSSSSTVARSSKFAATRETDLKKVETRMKQIKFGKNTIGYDNYRAIVPITQRKHFNEHPRTPDPYELQSKRAFDGRIKMWRRELHKWDTCIPNSGITGPVSNTTAVVSLGELLSNNAVNTLDEIIYKVTIDTTGTKNIGTSDNSTNTNAVQITPGTIVDDSFERYLAERNNAIAINNNASTTNQNQMSNGEGGDEKEVDAEEEEEDSDDDIL